MPMKIEAVELKEPALTATVPPAVRKSVGVFEALFAPLTFTEKDAVEIMPDDVVWTLTVDCRGISAPPLMASVPSAKEKLPTEELNVPVWSVPVERLSVAPLAMVVVSVTVSVVAPRFNPTVPALIERE